LAIWILISIWVLSIILLFFIPRDKIRMAWMAGLFMQVMTWSIGVYVVEKGWLAYPVRFFASINRTSFSFEFFIYPGVGALFVTRYPDHKSKLYQAGYFVAACTVLTLMETILEKYTNLIRYINWEWYTTWISLSVTLFVTRWFCVWFFGKSAGVR
jgi:hypothetical protein